MLTSSRHHDFIEFRKKFPVFTFEKQEHALTSEGLTACFTFNLSDRYYFRPTLFIPRREFFIPDEILSANLEAVVFHIGMVELISYWKLTCAPRVVIRPFFLEESQVSWWKKLWFNGLGEFFYLNNITTNRDDFMKVEVESHNPVNRPVPVVRDEILIPVGGGKDSAVTLKLLGDRPGTLPMIMNPRGASLDVVHTMGFSNDGFLEIRRTLDPLMLQLNQEGFLNGHTPFSALLAFVSLLAAQITGKRFIALSNESSANEPTIPGTNINHQYSKSLEFEDDFRDYVKKYLSPDFDYFSFLRPLNELQIASLFTKNPGFFPVFKSCNAGSKSDSWCGACPKCIFTNIILSPFITPKDRFRIFGKELFDDVGLMPVFDQLTGIAREKPFDCVGTVDEVNLALSETIRLYGADPLPALLWNYRDTGQYKRFRERSFSDFLKVISDRHFVPGKFLEILNAEMQKVVQPGN